MAYDFCVGRGRNIRRRSCAAGRARWCATSSRAMSSVLRQDDRTAAGCLVHSRRKFDELIKVNQSPVALQAVQRIALIYRVEREVQALTADARLAMRQTRSR
ncbi:MAG: transposase [Rubrivivax sp.]|nr:transposase [Rubrivivax sp.]